MRQTNVSTSPRMTERGSLSKKARELKMEVEALDKAIEHLKQVRDGVYQRWCNAAYSVHCE